MGPHEYAISTGVMLSAARAYGPDGVRLGTDEPPSRRRPAELPPLRSGDACACSRLLVRVRLDARFRDHRGCRPDRVRPRSEASPAAETGPQAEAAGATASTSSAARTTAAGTACGDDGRARACPAAAPAPGTGLECYAEVVGGRPPAQQRPNDIQTEDEPGASPSASHHSWVKATVEAGDRPAARTDASRCSRRF